MPRARRGRSEGSIFERKDGRWSAEISLGKKPDGTRNRKTVYGSTKGEVAEGLRRLQVDHDAGRLVTSEDWTVGEYLRHWHATAAKEHVGEGTHERYRQLIEYHLFPVIGGVKLANLRARHVEQCYAAMRTRAGGGKPVGDHTRKFAGVILSAALNHAVRTQVIPSNPAAAVKKARPAEREMGFMTPPQARRFLAAARSCQNYALFALAMGTGARQGELLALTWADIDFARGTMDVRRSLSRVKGKFIIKEPKNRHSRRTVSLPLFALAALQAHRTAALKAGKIAGPVFSTRLGNYLPRTNVLRAFKTIVGRVNRAEVARAAAVEPIAGEPDLIPATIRFHDLRHTHASGLIADGASIKAVSRRLGHADVTTTLKVYAHLMPDDDEKLAGKAGALFG